MIHLEQLPVNKPMNKHKGIEVKVTSKLSESEQLSN